MSLQRKSRIVLSFFVVMVLGLNAMAFGQQTPDRSTRSAVTPEAYLTEPSLSPDRKEIAFVSGGDIWTVPASGGTASLLVSHTANEARPMYSPDGKQIAFVSSRTGNGDIYLLTLASGELRRLTFDDGLDLLDGWSRDGRWIYFSSTRSGTLDIWRQPAAGGAAEQITFGVGRVPIESPDGRAVYYERLLPAGFDDGVVKRFRKTV